MFHLYGFLIGLGILLGFWFSSRKAAFFSIPQSFLENAIFWIFVPAVVGARTYHVLTDWPLYSHGPILNVIRIWEGGLGFFGALIGGVIGILLYIHFLKQKHPKLAKYSTTTKFFVLLDLFSFGAPVAQMIGRFGNYFNQELYGLSTNLPWGITIQGVRYHPLFLYEALLNCFVFIVLEYLSRGKKLVIGKGQYAAVYLISYGIIRFWLEFLRPVSAHFSGSLDVFSIAQWVAITISVIGLIIFWLRRHSDRGVEWELQTLV